MTGGCAGIEFEKDGRFGVEVGGKCLARLKHSFLAGFEPE